MMNTRTTHRVVGAFSSAAILLVYGLLGVPQAVADTIAPVHAFQAAGNVGGGVLTPGDMFPPDDVGYGRLVRKKDKIEVTIMTSGLPPGAYTVWWVVFNKPRNCAGPGSCAPPDLFNPAVQGNVFYATGGIVGEDGRGFFRATYHLGDYRGAPGTQNVIDSGPINPKKSEIHNIIKYHGPVSADPATLHLQVTSLVGACESGANAVDLGPPFGLQCFDPQAVVFPARGKGHDDDDDDDDDDEDDDD